jgi:hypothetical protein
LAFPRLALLAFTSLTLLAFSSLLSFPRLAARGRVLPTGKLLQAVDQVGVVLDHHRREFFNFLVLRFFPRELRQLDFALIVHQQPMGHHACTLSACLAPGLAALARALLVGLSLTLTLSRLGRLRLRLLSRLHLALSRLGRRLCLRLGLLRQRHRCAQSK